MQLDGGPHEGEPDPGSDPTSPPDPGAAFPWGWCIVALGIVTLAVRYLGWPLGGGKVFTAVTGGAIGLIVAGLSQEKRRREALGTGSSTAPMVLAIGLAVGVSVLCIILRPRFTDAITPWETIALPGLEVRVPGWEVEERGKSFEMGRLQLKGPEASDRFIQLQWAIGDPVSGDEFGKLWTGMGMEVKSREATRVSGHDAVRLEFMMPSKRVFTTFWHCPKYDRGQYLASFLARSRDRLLAIHSEIEASVKCHQPLDGPIPGRVFPLFTTPSGFVEQKSKNVILYTSEHEYYAFNPAFPGRKMLAPLSSNRQVVTNLLSVLLEAPDLSLSGGVRSHRDASGQPRYVWKGTATLDGEPSRIAFVVWGCKGSNRTFIGYYAGPPNPAADPVPVLLTARCP